MIKPYTPLYGIALFVAFAYLAGYALYRWSGRAHYVSARDIRTACINPGISPGIFVRTETPNERFFATLFRPFIAVEDFVRREP